MATVGQQLLAPESGWTRFEQTDVHFVFAGDSWADNPGANYSGGSAKYTFGANLHSVSFAFNGSGLRIISYRDSDRQANISVVIDGVSYSYSARGAAGSQILLFEKDGLTDGNHTVTISASNSGLFSIFEFDAIDLKGSFALIGGALTGPESGWKRIEDSDPSIRYMGAGWSADDPNSAYSGGGRHWAPNTTANSSYRFLLMGTQFRIIASIYPGYSGKVAVTIDGGAVEYFTLNGGDINQTLVYQKTGLSDSLHHVDVTKIDQGAYSTDFNLDAIDVNESARLVDPISYLIQDGSDIKKCVLTEATPPSIESVTATSTYQGSASNLIDGNTGTVWWSNGSGHQSLVFRLSSAFAIASLDLTTGGKAQDVPASFTLYGSNDGANYTLITNIPSCGFTGALYEKRSFSFSNDTAYRYYKVDLFNNFNWMQLSEVRILPGTTLVATWVKVGDAPVTQSMFDTDGMVDLELINDKTIQSLVSDQPKVLASTNASTVSSSMTAVPFGRVILPTDDITLPPQGFKSLQLAAGLSGAGELKILASIDGGTTWMTWDGSTWTASAADAASAKANGMTPAVFNAVPVSQWQQLIGETGKIRFAYYLEQSNSGDVAYADQITIQPSDVANETPVIESVGITFDEVTLAGRLKDLEQINAINMAKLNFKSNALLASAKYSLYEMVVDTFDTSDGVDSSATTATYDTINKRYNGAGDVVMAAGPLQDGRKSLLVVLDGSTDVVLHFSLDDGATWQTIAASTVTDIRTVTGNDLMVKATLPAVASSLTGIACSWA
ncbi:F5/8 type C domain-containing protein [Paenibacillus sp. UNC496MF]|uniref:discoidin domain-containing protein n=1 Tax=Paenibacillus sp. UNC496MF TaxID=1502753 RepID=UPI0008E95B19|nr:discoidin domain-containing protein [Paenibacillus sp. UNC496MF]SFJ65954.1 F5/8 type C domain-containing protein [Paenibacillus sp. UNC496MF]